MWRQNEATQNRLNSERIQTGWAEDKRERKAELPNLISQIIHKHCALKLKLEFYFIITILQKE